MQVLTFSQTLTLSKEENTTMKKVFNNTHGDIYDQSYLSALAKIGQLPPPPPPPIEPTKVPNFHLGALKRSASMEDMELTVVGHSIGKNNINRTEEFTEQVNTPKKPRRFVPKQQAVTDEQYEELHQLSQKARVIGQKVRGTKYHVREQWHKYRKTPHPTIKESSYPQSNTLFGYIQDAFCKQGEILDQLPDYAQDRLDSLYQLIYTEYGEAALIEFLEVSVEFNSLFASVVKADVLKLTKFLFELINKVNLESFKKLLDQFNVIKIDLILSKEIKDLKTVKNIRQSNSKLLKQHITAYEQWKSEDRPIGDNADYTEEVLDFNVSSVAIDELAKKLSGMADKAAAFCSEKSQKAEDYVKKASPAADTLGAVGKVVQGVKNHAPMLAGQIYNLITETDKVKWFIALGTTCSMLGINKSIIDMIYNYFSGTTQQVGKSTLKLIALASSMLGDKSPIHKLTNIKSFFSLTREVEAVEKVVKLLEDALEEFGFTESEGSKLAKMLKEEFSYLFDRLREYETRQLLNPNKFLYQKHFDEFHADYKKMLQLEKDMSMKSVDLGKSSMPAEVALLARKFSQLYDEIMCARRGAVRRMEPLAIALKGIRGIGKTKLATDLVATDGEQESLLVKRFKERGLDKDKWWEDLDFPSWQVWNENFQSGVAYANGYNQQQIHFVDDLFQAADHSDHLRWMNYISNARFLTEQARIEAKGMPYESKLIVGTTNTIPTTSSTINTIEALQRRFMVVHVDQANDPPSDYDRTFAHLRFTIYNTMMDYRAKTNARRVNLEGLLDIIIDGIAKKYKMYLQETGHTEQLNSVFTRIDPSEMRRELSKCKQVPHNIQEWGPELSALKARILSLRLDVPVPPGKSNQIKELAVDDINYLNLPYLMRLIRKWENDDRIIGFLKRYKVAIVETMQYGYIWCFTDRAYIACGDRTRTMEDLGTDNQDDDDDDNDTSDNFEDAREEAYNQNFSYCYETFSKVAKWLGDKWREITKDYPWLSFILKFSYFFTLGATNGIYYFIYQIICSFIMSFSISYAQSLGFSAFESWDQDAVNLLSMMLTMVYQFALGPLIVFSLSFVISKIYNFFNAEQEACEECKQCVSEVAAIHVMLKKKVCNDSCKLNLVGFKSHSTLCKEIEEAVNVMESVICECNKECHEACSHKIVHAEKERSIRLMLQLRDQWHKYYKCYPIWLTENIEEYAEELDIEIEDVFEACPDCTDVDHPCARHTRNAYRVLRDNDRYTPLRTLKKRAKEAKGKTAEDSDTSKKNKAKTKFSFESGDPKKTKSKDKFSFQKKEDVYKYKADDTENYAEQLFKDPNARVISNVIKEVTVPIYKQNKDNNKTSMCYCIGHENYVLAPGHIWGGPQYRYFIKKQEKEIDIELVAHNRSRDVALFKFDSKNNQFPSKAFNHIPTEVEVNSYMPNSTGCILYTPTVELMWMVDAEVTKEASLNIKVDGNIRTYEKLIKTRTIGMREAPSTVHGDCGGALVMCNPLAAHKLVGFHVLGALDAAHSAYSTLLTKELVDDLVAEDTQEEFQQEYDLGEVNATLIPGAKYETVDIYNLVKYERENPKHQPGDDIDYVGDLDFNAVPAKDTSLERHVLFGTFPEKTKPACLKVEEVKDKSKLVDNNWGEPDLLETQYVKYAGEPTKIDGLEDALENMVDELSCLYISVLNEDDLTIMNEQQILTGVIENPNSKPLDMRTTPGEPWGRLGKQSGKKKTQYLKIRTDPSGRKIFNLDINTPHGAKLWECIQLKDQLAYSGRRSLSLWKNCLKDETRPLEKVKFGKTRLFTAAPFESLYLSRKYFGKFKDAWQAHRSELMHSVGINPHSSEWTELAQTLLKRGDQFFDGDYSSYDGRLRADFMRAAGQVVINTLKFSQNDEIPRHVYEIIWDEFVETYHVAGTNVHLVKHGNPSGNPMTTVVNCIVNLMYHWYCYTRITGNTSLASFQEDVGFTCFGDDVIYSTIEEVTNYSFNKVAVIMKELGQEYTTALKDAGECVGRPITEVQFLKRKFKREGISFASPLDFDSIEQQFNWTQIGASDLDTVNAQIKEALIEACQHGVIKYSNFLLKLRSAVMTNRKMRDHLSTSLKSYHESRQELSKRMTSILS